MRIDTTRRLLFAVLLERERQRRRDELARLEAHRATVAAQVSVVGRDGYSGPPVVPLPRA
jgi:hypothetical protein